MLRAGEVGKRALWHENAESIYLKG